MIEFVSHHPITVIAILIAVVLTLTIFVQTKRRLHSPAAVEHLDSAIGFTESQRYRTAGVTDPLTFWRDEIRRIADKYGSPVKASIQLERSINAPSLGSLDDGELEALNQYWREISKWCGRVRIELNKLDPKAEWSPNAWTRLFNAFGRINMLVLIAWSERSDNRATRKPSGL